jgi:hypothetical protein
MTMNNPLGREAITRTLAPLNPKLHKIRVPVSLNWKLFLIQMTRLSYHPSPHSHSGISKHRLTDDYKGMLIS